MSLTSWSRAYLCQNNWYYTLNFGGAHPKHPRTCAGQWSRHHRRSTCPSSGSPSESPSRSRSWPWPGYNLCRLFARVRPGQPWPRSCHRKIPITSPAVYGERVPAEPVSLLSTIRACVHNLRLCATFADEPHKPKQAALKLTRPFFFTKCRTREIHDCFMSQTKFLQYTPSSRVLTHCAGCARSCRVPETSTYGS